MLLVVPCLLNEIPGNNQVTENNVLVLSGTGMSRRIAHCNTPNYIFLQRSRFLVVSMKKRTVNLNDKDVANKTRKTRGV